LANAALIGAGFAVGPLWFAACADQSKDRNIDHLHENLGAINMQLTPADLRELETAVSGITVHGGRMNQEQMGVVDQAA
jgi:hypothetical protein